MDATIQPTDMPAFSLHLFAGAGGGILADLVAAIRLGLVQWKEVA